MKEAVKVILIGAAIVWITVFSWLLGVKVYNASFPGDTYLWAEIKGEWHRIGKPTTMDICLEVLSEVEKIYPNTLMICLTNNILPYNAKQVEGIQI